MYFEKVLTFGILVLCFPCLIRAGDDSIIAYWPLEGDAFDASCNGHDGVVEGAPTTTSGHFGKALRFDGVDDAIAVPWDQSFNDLPALTIAAWVLTERDSHNETIVESQRSFGPQPIGGTFFCGVAQATLNLGTYSAGESHHVCCTFQCDAPPCDSVFNPWVLRGYLDGVFVDEATSGIAIENTGCDITMARTNQTTCDGPRIEYLQGSIDEVIILRRALSASEVLALTNDIDVNGRADFFDPFDSDGDSVFDACDLCPGFDDALPCPIPAVSEWGMVAMALLLVTVGTILIAKRKASSAI